MLYSDNTFSYSKALSTKLRPTDNIVRFSRKGSKQNHNWLAVSTKFQINIGLLRDLNCEHENPIFSFLVQKCRMAVRNPKCKFSLSFNQTSPNIESNIVTHVKCK